MVSFNTTVRQMIEFFQWPKCVSKNDGNVSAKKKPRSKTASSTSRQHA